MNAGCPAPPLCRSIKGCGKVNHLSTRQLRVQGAVASRGLIVQNISRQDTGADLLAHPCGVRVLGEHLVRLCLARRPAH